MDGFFIFPNSLPPDFRERSTDKIRFILFDRIFLGKGAEKLFHRYSVK